MPNWGRAPVLTVWVIFGTTLGYFARGLLDFELTYGNKTAPVVAALAFGYVAAVGLPAFLAWWLIPEVKVWVFFIVFAGGLLGTEAVTFLVRWGPF